MKQKKGITLVTLIVAIIILIILAGVSISMVFGEEGIFSKTQLAAEKYKNAQEKEITALGKYENEINSYINGDRDNYNITTNDIGKIVIYSGNTNKIVLFKIVEINGEKATIACIPNNETPRININGNAGASDFGSNTDDEYATSFIGKTKKIILDKCIDSFKNENLGINESDIRIANRVDYENGWIPQTSEQEYWLAECDIYRNGSDANWSKYRINNAGIGTVLIYNIKGAYTANYECAVCPIITINKNLLKTNVAFVLE